MIVARASIFEKVNVLINPLSSNAFVYANSPILSLSMLNENSKVANRGRMK
jgi:hypothetical protein